MDLFDNGDPEAIFLFVWNFQMTLEESVTLAAGAKIRYLHTLVRGKKLIQLDTLSVEVVSTALDNLKLIILGLGT